MEANQITCPQCGLVNNYLTDACVQCGLIFVKSPAVKAAQATQDEEKRKAIQMAEDMLNQSRPPAADDAPVNETIKRPDPLEDTVEIKPPQEAEPPEIKSSFSDSMAPAPAENKETQNVEIEMEAIETAMEAVTQPSNAEALIISEAEAGQPDAPELVEDPLKSADAALIHQQAVDEPAETDNSVSAGEDKIAPQADAAAVKPPATQPQENPIITESEKTPSGTEVSASAEAATEDPLKPSESLGRSTLKDDARPVESEIQLEKKAESAPVEKAAVRPEVPPEAAVPIEMIANPNAVDPQANQQAQKAKQEILKKQQAAQAEAESRKKEEAARAKTAALKKKKLAQAKAEALKKQKAAQAKAEALKKKKAARAKALALKKQRADQVRRDALRKQIEAQARAEASAEEAQAAGGTTASSVSHAADMGRSNRVRLLGLLKRYTGKAIGINYDNSAEIKRAELVAANEEFFTVMVKDKKIQYSYPLKTILTIVEGERGVETGKNDQKAKFDAVIKVYPLV